MPQIWAPYSIVGLTTAVYSSRVRLKEGPQVDAAIRNTAAKAAESRKLAITVITFLNKY